MKITSLALKKPIAVGIIILTLLVLGIYGFWHLSIDFLPDLTYPLIKVHIWWRGATPEEIDRNLADPIEREMATVDHLDYLESSTIEGMYTLLVNFRYGADIDVAYQDALAAMARVARELPKDIEPPVIIKADPSQLPVVQMTISSEGSDQWDLVKLRTWTENWLQDQLTAVSGVAGTEIVGGLKREIRVHLDPEALEKYGLSLSSVIRRLQEENIEQFGGRVTSGAREFIARTIGEYRNLEEIRSVILARNGDDKVYLRDVATVSDSHEETRVITRLGGKPCVKLSVLKQAEANTVEVAKAVSRRIQELESGLPEGIKLGMVENQADYIESAIKSVRDALIGAIILVIIVLYLFLGSFRQIAVMFMVLPIILILNFGLMKLAGFSLNIFTLAGLVVGTGTLLDHSTVIIENITRWRMEKPTLPISEICLSGTSEVGTAVIAATTSFLALFVPFLFVPGLTSLLFKELILVLSSIVLISLVVSVSATPMFIALFFGQSKRESVENNPFQRFFNRLTEAQGKLLAKMLKVRWLVVGCFIFFLLTALFLLPKLGTEFLPPTDDGRIMIKVKMPTGTAIGKTAEILGQIESKIAQDPLIESYFTLAGGKVWGLYTYEIANEGEVDIQLIPRSKRKVSTKEYIERLRPVMAKIQIPGGQAMVNNMPIKGIRKLGEADIEVKIKGQELEKLFSLAKQTSEKMNTLNNFTNVYVSMDMTKPEYQVQVDRIRAAELGVSMADVAFTLRTLVGGTIATQYREGSEYYNIRVMVPEKKISSRFNLENLILDCAQGGHLRLREVAKVEQAVGPVEIVRDDQIKEVIVRGDVVGTSIGQALKELKKELNSLDRPLGYEFFYGGQAQMMLQMKQTVLTILAFAVFFAFAILVVQFNSIKIPGLIFLGVPFCWVGMAYLLQLFKVPLGATVIIGALMVVAALINDGVLLMEFAEDIRRNNTSAPISEVVLTAAKTRLRPQLMTTLTTIVGFLPLALNIGEGGDMLRPMAIAAIGGLSMEILVSIYLLPCLYSIFSRKYDNHLIDKHP